MKKILAVSFFLFCMTFHYSYAFNPTNIDMQVISLIESNNNHKAISKDKHGNPLAYGLYQITQPALSDYNHYNITKYTLQDMLSPSKCYIVSRWLITQRYPQLLSYYKIPITLDNLLIAYHDGARNCALYIQGKRLLGKNMKNYLKKYKILKGAEHDNTRNVN